MNTQDVHPINDLLTAGASSERPIRGVAALWLVQHWPELTARVGIRQHIVVHQEDACAYFDWDGLAAALDGAGAGAHSLDQLSGGAYWALEAAVALACGRACSWDRLLWDGDRAQELIRMLAKGHSPQS